MKMRFFYSVDRGRWLCRRIAAITGGKYSHSGVAFYEGNNAVYFESIATRTEIANEHGKLVKKNGVRGPLKLDRLRDWVAAKPRRRRYILQPEYGYLPFTVEEVDEAYKAICLAVHEIKYAKLQILRNWLSVRLRLGIRTHNGSPDRWTCSETCARVVPNRFAGFYGWPDWTADNIAPSGYRLPSIHAATTRMLATHQAID